MKTSKLSVCAMFSALTALLGFLGLEMGNLKITFESLPILIAGLLFGPSAGALTGGIGVGLYQILRYGISVTTVVWILPYIVTGWFIGMVAKRKHFSNTRKEIIMGVTIAEFIISFLNTGAMYIDSKVFGYYSAGFVFGSFGIRIFLAVVKASVFSMVLPIILTKMAKITGNVRSDF